MSTKLETVLPPPSPVPESVRGVMASMGFPSSELYVDYFKNFIWMGVCLYVCKRNPQRLKEGTDPLEMKLQMVLSHHMSVGNPTWVLRKSSKCS